MIAFGKATLKLSSVDLSASHPSSAIILARHSQKQPNLNPHSQDLMPNLVGIMARARTAPNWEERLIDRSEFASAQLSIKEFHQLSSTQSPKRSSLAATTSHYQHNLPRNFFIITSHFERHYEPKTQQW